MPLFSSDLHNILLYFLSFLWIIEFIVFKPQYKGSDYYKEQSFKTIFVVIITIILGTLLYNQFNLFVLPEYTYIYFNYFGIFLFMIGIFIRYYTRFTLGQHFKRKIKGSNDKKLISHGPYKLLAHPLYVGLFFLVLAVPIYFGQLIWIIAAILFFGKVMLVRMKAEEKALEDSLKETYTKWLKKRYRFIPWIY